MKENAASLPEMVNFSVELLGYVDSHGVDFGRSQRIGIYYAEIEDTERHLN